LQWSQFITRIPPDINPLTKPDRRQPITCEKLAFYSRRLKLFGSFFKKNMLGYPTLADNDIPGDNAEE
jgi:hypothetical protein